MLKLLVFLPLLGSIFSGLFPAILGRKGSIWIPTLFCFVSLIFSIILLIQAIGGVSYIVHLGYWIKSESLTVSWALKLDMLSAIMLFVAVSYTHLTLPTTPYV